MISVYARSIYWEVLRAAPAGFDIFGASVGMKSAVERAAARSEWVGIYGQAADRWIARSFGRSDDALRRAYLAAAALDLARRTRDFPEALKSHQALAHDRLAAYLERPRDHNAGSFSRDSAFVCGLAVPAGALTLFIPPQPSLSSTAFMANRLVRDVVKQSHRNGVRHGWSWARRIGTRRWIDLHLDERYLRRFSPPGLRETYTAAAVLLDARPDLGGVRGVSWLFDPQLEDLSRKITFMRDIPFKGGATFSQLRTDADQIEYALRKSAQRRRAHAEGRYHPVCYAMHWFAQELAAWAVPQAQIGLQDQPSLQAA